MKTESSIGAIAEAAIHTAEKWQNRANSLLTSEERGIQEQMLRLLTHPMDKVVLTQLIDQSFRSHDHRRVADQISNLLASHGVPDFFSRVEKLLVQMFMGFGRYIPSVSVPTMIQKMRHDSSRAIIPGETDALHAHLNKRRGQRVRMNINHLGEAVLGEVEARHRLTTYMADMADPAIEVISVKISTIYSQISSLAMDASVSVLVERLTELYRAAMRNRFERADGQRVPKMVNLDMEEYRDLEITVAAFMQTLDQPEFKGVMAGIVLQAYLPDSFPIQRKLTEWAQQRIAAGGAPMMLRIVKGANMEMEQLEASLFNWPLAPYNTKAEVDANYKRMVGYGMAPERIHAVHLGIASHNLFELAYAFELAKVNAVTEFFHFEMLEGMADHVRRALSETDEDMLLYAPVATREEFINAIAYLVRRLDENTSEENFLRYAPHLTVDSTEWAFLKEQFRHACAIQEDVREGPSRVQDRNTEVFPATIGTLAQGSFRNEADTDWCLAANRRWAYGICERWQHAAEMAPADIPIVIGGERRVDGRELRDCNDPSQYRDRVTIARYAMATEADLAEAVAVAKADPDGWRDLSCNDHHRVLTRVAAALRAARGDLIGVAAADTGKAFTESDVEISEAIDFAEFYPWSVQELNRIPTIRTCGKGVGLVVSPWNFPIAIPCGGIVSALAAGNTVIFKPASDAVATAWELCQCFYRAGVSENVLQFVPCDGSVAGRAMVGHADVDFIILTGGTETGLHMLSQAPGIFLAAETGGKNATIVTAMADRDQAIKNVLYSAFGNGGQKCSATSLLILEGEIYDDPGFQRQLADAAASLKVGSAWVFENKLTPLIRPPSGELADALADLLPGESWALQPAMVDDNPHLWSPGIKWGVTAGSVTHMTEFFGPLLGVMRADTLDHAIDLVNQTGFGLTSGIESLDEREVDRWKSRIHAGNLYINRGTTGAITLRQPFGGMGKSSLGPGLKAGSPDYVSQWMVVDETAPPEIGVIHTESRLVRLAHDWLRRDLWGEFGNLSNDVVRSARAALSYRYRYESHFARELDFFHLRGQDNLLRYLPVGRTTIRVTPMDSLFDVLARVAAAETVGCTVTVSLPAELTNSLTEFLYGPDGQQWLGAAVVEAVEDDQLIAELGRMDRLRYAAEDRVPDSVMAAAAESNGFYIARSPVLMEGRLELLHYLTPQSICHNYHRYGNLGGRTIL